MLDVDRKHAGGRGVSKKDNARDGRSWHAKPCMMFNVATNRVTTCSRSRTFWFVEAVNVVAWCQLIYYSKSKSIFNGTKEEITFG